MPALQSHHAELRALAMRCVSLYAHAAHAAALRFWPLLLKVLRNPDPNPPPPPSHSPNPNPSPQPLTLTPHPNPNPDPDPNPNPDP